MALARADGDRGGGAERVVAQDLVEHAEDHRVQRQRVQRAGLGEQGVDPAGVAPFELVAAGRGGLEDRLEVRPGGRRLRGGDGIGDDRVPGLAELGHDIARVAGCAHVTLPKGMFR